MADSDYVLGTHDAEIERLGLQHRVWRPRMLDAFRRAGITSGQHVADIGCGPGYAAIDLAEIVGASGQVTAYDQSARFLAHLRTMCQNRGLANVEIVEADLATFNFPHQIMDALWCRWVLAFVPTPERLVRQACLSLRPNGIAVFHEYLDYGSWCFMPSRPALERFVHDVIASWRSAGGEPNIGKDLPLMLERAGLDVISITPIIDVVTPDNFVWNWPEEFLKVNVSRLRELGRISKQEADEVLAEFEAVKAISGVRMVTPCVLEVIARKR